MEKVVSCPMVDLLSTAQTSEDICFYSDASGKYGYGCLLNNKWIHGCWDTEFLTNCKPSIEFLELFALVAGILTWQHELRDARFTVFCDNTAIVQMINSLTSSCANCVNLLRLLTLNGLQFNRRISAKYVDTKSNFLADALSRGQMDHFRKLGPVMNIQPDSIDDRLWPIQKVWDSHK